jgi:hypothetical protein
MPSAADRRTELAWLVGHPVDLAPGSWVALFGAEVLVKAPTFAAVLEGLKDWPLPGTALVVKLPCTPTSAILRWA